MSSQVCHKGSALEDCHLGSLRNTTTLYQFIDLDLAWGHKVNAKQKKKKKEKKILASLHFLAHFSADQGEIRSS